MIFQKIIQNGLYIVVSQRLFFGHSEKIMKLRNVNGKQFVSGGAFCGGLPGSSAQTAL